MAQVLDNDKTLYVDIDETLVMWDQDLAGNVVSNNSPFEGSIEIIDPYDHQTFYLSPNNTHIRLLKKIRETGYMVIVWSHAGAKWAEAVINALNLRYEVDLIISKPIKYIDDQVYGDLGSRIYIK